MARFGYLWLRGGAWNGKQLLPAAYVREALTPSAHGPDYGYLWWPFPSPVRSDSAFAGVGIFGQYLYVNPQARVVIALWSAQTRPTGGEVLNDVAFFDAVVRPYLANKLQPGFIDQWLLEQDLTSWLSPDRHQRLNLCERILLARRLGGEVGAQELASVRAEFAELDDEQAELLIRQCRADRRDRSR